MPEAAAMSVMDMDAFTAAFNSHKGKRSSRGGW